ncbi:MAG: phosphoglucosamine mutase, partial [Vicinamibacterales bacterium]
GVTPTPAVAYLTKDRRFDAGVVISASHNPFPDNGIKLFTSTGEKAGGELESSVEASVADRSWQVSDGGVVHIDRADFGGAYMTHASRALPDPGPLGQLKIAIDCANGATTAVAPRLLRELGFDVLALHCAPDGRNINRQCGSTQPGDLAQAVVDGGCRLGVAYDGDGDRAVFVDHRGRVIDGDAVLLMCAKQLQATGRLRGNAVVATVMSNVGLELALQELGIELVRCPVGDRYVMEEIVRRGLSLGGEQSGHVIFADHLPTGDGITTTLSVLRIMAETNRDLADLASDLTAYPQVLVNIPVRQKEDLRSVPEVAAALATVEKRLAGQGRLLVRYSGTEPLLRVMIEGQDQPTIDRWAQEIAEKVREHLG